MKRRALFGFLGVSPVAVAASFSAAAEPAAAPEPLEIELIRPGSPISSAQFNRIFAALQDGINELRGCKA